MIPRRTGPSGTGEGTDRALYGVGGKRDANERFEAGGQTVKAAKIGSSAVPSLQALATRALPDDLAVPETVAQSLPVYLNSWRPPQVETGDDLIPSSFWVTYDWDYYPESVWKSSDHDSHAYHLMLHGREGMLPPRENGMNHSWGYFQ